jgi:hypothetical protein
MNSYDKIGHYLGHYISDPESQRTLLVTWGGIGIIDMREKIDCSR